jgi:hypothetical protein
MNEHGWRELAMENSKDTKAALTLQIGMMTGCNAIAVNVVILNM